MSQYRYITIVFQGGHQVRTVVKDEELNPELYRLQMLYRAKIRVGRRLPADKAALWDELEARQAVHPKGAVPARPLSPDFGRGSGAPV